MVSRRTVLLGAGAVAAVAVGGAVPLIAARDDDAPAPGPIVRGSFVSAKRLGARVDWVLARPPGVAGTLPLVVALHGYGGTAELMVDDDWDLAGALARAVTAGAPPFALVTVSGGTTFYHPRPSGEDAGAMVTDELLPLLGDRADELGIDTDRLGLIGWSMGGYGVLRLAPILDARPGATPVAAVVAASPGLYTDPEAAHPDGFADAAEYERFSVMHDQADLAGTPLRIDVGTDDDFCAAVRVYVDGFAPDADVTATFGPGGHTVEFARGVLPDQLAFLGTRVGSTT